MKDFTTGAIIVLTVILVAILAIPAKEVVVRVGECMQYDTELDKEIDEQLLLLK